MKRACILFLTACLCLSPAGCFSKQSEQLPTSAPETMDIQPIPEETLMQTETATVPAETVQEHSETEAVEIPAPEIPEYLTDDALVPVKRFIPDLVVELKYATQDNFTGSVIYDFEEVYLRLGTVKKLMLVQSELRDMGMGLKIWDGFRPVWAQRSLWDVRPDPNYVSHPETGARTHCRGNTVDVTLVDSSGMEFEMPSGFDAFTAQGDRNYSDCTEIAGGNAVFLEQIMDKYGFSGITSEWWHFVDETDYPVEEKFTPVQRSQWYAVCESHINLRPKPDADSTAVSRILKDETFTMMALCGNFAMVEYRDMIGYVHRGYIGQV